MPSSLLGVPRAETADDVAAPVAALGGEARVAEHVGHERGEHVRHRDDVEAPLPGRNESVYRAATARRR